VVVWHPDERIEIRCYPESDFPPTDFHSATLVGDRVFLVGSLGYVGSRSPGRTQVLSLDTHSLRVERIETTGVNPGWISGHNATLESDGIRIGAGQIQHENGLIENIDDWLLELPSYQWKRLTDLQWPRFEFVRKDGEMNHLWQLRQERFMRDVRSHSLGNADLEETFRQTMDLLSNQTAHCASDEQLVEQLYRPAVEHELIPRDETNFEEHNVYRVRIDRVVARYVEESHAIVLTVEGTLPPSTLDVLVGDLQAKLTRLENADVIVRRW
jgi:hypothetical protein